MKTFFATYTYTCMDLIFQEKRILGCHSLLLFRLDSIFSSPVLEAELAGSGGESPAHPGARRSLVPEDERSGAVSRPPPEPQPRPRGFLGGLPRGAARGPGGPRARRGAGKRGGVSAGRLEHRRW